MMKKILKILIIITLLSLPALYPLFKSGFFPTHDYIYVARIFQMFESLADGQFPVRWVSGFRYGEPLYNFYAPLPYYIGAVTHLLGFGYLSSAKVLFGLSLALSGCSMYFLVKELFGKYPALLASVLYIYAPYRSVDIYVRGAVSESWAFVFFPLIFLFTYKLAKGKNYKNIIFLALSLAGLFYTHNIATMMFIPFYLAWGGYWVIVNRSTKVFLDYVKASILGIALAASYLLPAYFEKKFIQTQFVTQGYFDFRAHYVTIRQLFDTFWGYGASLWGPKDDMPFQMGPVHWVLVALVFASIAFYLYRTKTKNLGDSYKVLILFLALLATSLFFQHNRSTFIWIRIDVLKYIQFPWRFMAVSIFFASIIASYACIIVEKKEKLVMIVLIAATILVNVQYFHPESYYTDSIDEHYVGKKVLMKDDKMPRDYLPLWVKQTNDTRDLIPFSDVGDIVVENFYKDSKSSGFYLETTKDATITVPVTYYPGWILYIDGEEHDTIEPDEEGLIRFDVGKGEYEVTLGFEHTNLRLIADIISFAALLLVIYLFFRKKKHPGV